MARSPANPQGVASGSEASPDGRLSEAEGSAVGPVGAPALDQGLARRAAAAKPATRPTDPLIGVVLDEKYRLDSPLGKGGSGRVYVATQLSLQRQVAVKVMRPELEEGGDERYAERFFREASKAGGLSHPNVVTVHDYGRTDSGLCYIAMELLDGRSLKRIMKAGPIELERALDIFEQIVRGLRHAHRAGLVHRDVKPGNVQILAGDEFQDVAKLLDFGLVKSAEAEVTEITRDGSFLGTPHYAAPEQVRGLEADARSDLYAVGVMLYRACTGKLPYSSRNAMSLAMSHVRDPYPPMAERAPDVPVPEVVEAIVRRCMEKDPARRYQSADQLLAELQRARRTVRSAAVEQGSGAIAAVPVEPGTVAPAEAPAAAVSPSLDETTLPEGKGSWLRGLAIGGGAALLLALLGGGALLLGPLASPEPVVAAVVEPVASAPELAALAEEPELRMLPAVISSEPLGATVILDGQTRGTTPWADTVEVLGERLPTLRLELKGHRAVEPALEEHDGAIRVEAALPRIRRARPAPKRRAAPTSARPAPETRPAPSAPAPSKSSAATVDGVAFSGAEAARTTRFANSATEAQLRAAGIGTTQLRAVERGRPYADIQAVGAAPGVGQKTLERLKSAS